MSASYRRYIDITQDLYSYSSTYYYSTSSVYLTSPWFLRTFCFYATHQIEHGLKPRANILFWEIPYGCGATGKKRPKIPNLKRLNLQ